jgi:hypothetical protein
MYVFTVTLMNAHRFGNRFIYSLRDRVSQCLFVAVTNFTEPRAESLWFHNLSLTQQLLTYPVRAKLLQYIIVASERSISDLV